MRKVKVMKMAIKGLAYLTTNQRKRLKNIHKGSPFGMYIHRFYINQNYSGVIMINTNRTSLIEIKNEQGETFSSPISNRLIGTWNIKCNNDKIQLEVR